MSRSGQLAVPAWNKLCCLAVDANARVLGGCAAVYTHRRRPLRSGTPDFDIDFDGPAAPRHNRSLVPRTEARAECGGSDAPIFSVLDLMAFGHDRLHVVRHAQADS
jgi:hypothetical protein